MLQRLIPKGRKEIWTLNKKFGNSKNMKRYLNIALSILVIAMGIGVLQVAHYIETEIAKGKKQLKKAEKMVGGTGSLLSITPLSKEVGDELLSGSRAKIQAAHGDIAFYTQLAEALIWGGWAVIGIGALWFLIAFIKFL